MTIEQLETILVNNFPDKRKYFITPYNDFIKLSSFSLNSNDFIAIACIQTIHRKEISIKAEVGRSEIQIYFNLI